MPEKLGIYKCSTCGNIVQVLIDGGGELNCCGQSMEKATPKTIEGHMGEYHVPIIAEDQNEKYVQVGQELHPMTKEHHIEFIETISEDNKCIKIRFLDEEEVPKIKINNENDEIKRIIEMCNLHGLWEGKNDKQ